MESDVFMEAEDLCRNDQVIAAIIAGHTTGGLENLSLTERRYQESMIMSDGNKIRHQPDGSYYTG